MTVVIEDKGDGKLAVKSVDTKTIKNEYAVKPIEVDPTSAEAKTEFGKKNVTATTADGKDKTFKFTLAKVGDAPMPKSANAEVTYNAGATGEKTIPFGKITYSAAGEYTYTITEADPGNGWTATGNPATVTVKVTDNGDGTLSAEVNKTAEINNAYAVEEITVDPTDAKTKFGVKNVTKAAEDNKAKTFDFKLEAVTEGAPMPTSATASVTYQAGKDGKETIPFGEITYRAAGEYEYRITESAPGKGWTVSNNGAPVIVKVKDNGNGTLSAEVIKAAEIGNGYKTDKITVDPTNANTKFGEKNVTATTADGKAKTFKFKLEAVTEGAPMPKSPNAEVTYDAGATGVKAIPFGSIEYDKVGNYTYRITESAAGSGWTTTGNSAQITVKVTDNGDGTLSAKVEDTAQITNSYAVAPIDVDPTDADAKTVFGKKNVTATTEDGKGHEFSFTLAKSGDAPMPAETTAKVSYDKDETGKKTIPFGAITYTAAGEYTYTITEADAGSGWTTAGSPATVTVKVTDNGDGTLSAKVEKTAEITNTYAVEPLVVDPASAAAKTEFGKKNVTATTEDGKGHEFSFTLKKQGDAPMPTEATAKVSYGKDETGAKTIPFGSITYTKKGEYKYTITEDKAGDGWTTTNNNAEVTVKVTDKGDGTLSAKVETVTIANSYKAEPVEVDTTDAKIGAFVTKTVTGSAFEPQSFDFTIAADNGAPAPAKEEATTEEFTAAGSKTVNFGKITFNSVGKFTYTVKETTAATDGWTNDNAEKKVTVNVTDNGKGQLEAKVEGATVTNKFTKRPHLKVEKETTSTAPAGGYALGDKITYKITVTNDGNVVIKGITLTDTVEGYDAKDISKDLDNKTLAPKETATATFEHVVTEQDIIAGKVANEATASGSDNDGDKPGVTPGKTEDDTEDPNPHITITKETTSTPASGGKYALGETIAYKITAKNDGNLTLTNVKVKDPLTEDEWTVAKLAPGESREFSADYTVKESDLGGKVVNEASAEAENPSDDPTEVVPGKKEDPTEDQKPAISVTKTANRTAGITQGSTVNYTITVTNTGNVTLRNVRVTDTLVAFSGNSGTIASLAPGATATLRYAYTATAANIAAGRIVNTATVTGDSPDDTSVTDSASVTATTRVIPGGGGDNPDNPGGGGGNPGGGGGNPAGGQVAPTVVPDEPVPTVEPEVDIVDPEPPLAEGVWALLNLIAAILTTLGAIVALFRRKEEEDEEDEEQTAYKAESDDEDENDDRSKKMLIAKIVGAIAGIAAPIVFMVTEDMSLPMALVDKWTVLMVVLLAVQIVAAALNKRASRLDDDDEEGAEQPAN